jgi:hypothetical protein
MAENYDNTETYTNIFKLLPSVYQSDVNRSLTENALNKFFTKDEVKNVVGTISKSYTDKDRLVDSDIHRQNFQLQPLLTAMIATEQYTSSFKDLMREAVRMGIDYYKFNEWGATTQHNFVPPINLDKLVNFADYYWISTDTPPDYVTIQNRRTQLQAIADKAYADNSNLEALIYLYKINFDNLIKAQIEAIYPGFLEIILELDFIIAHDPASMTYNNGWDWFNNLNVSQPNDEWDYVSQPKIPNEWDSPINYIQVMGMQPNAFILNNDWTLLFTAGLQFNASGGSNVGVFTTVSSAYNDLSNNTTVTVQQSVAIEPIVNTVLNISAYDSQAMSFDDTDIVGNWDKDTDHSYNVIGFPKFYSLQTDDWSASNKWVHSSDFPTTENITKYPRATMPIIEYQPFLQLNKWTKINYQWAYRTDSTQRFLSTDLTPSRDELFSSLTMTDIDNVGGAYSFDIVDIEDISVYSPGTEITIIFDDNIYAYYTIVSAAGDSTSLTLSVDKVLNSYSTSASVVPIRYTSAGDDWKGLFNQWKFIGIKNYNPVEPQETIDDELKLANTVNIQSAGQYVHWYNIGVEFDMSTQIRVYNNGRREIGKYQLGYTESPGAYTFGATNKKYNSIWFIDPVLHGTISVEIGPIALSDLPLQSVAVTTENGIENISLVEYEFTEQLKHGSNVYPMFDMFALDGTTVYKSSELWKFAEDSSYPVDPRIGYRIMREGQTYQYDQMCYVDNTMYAFKTIDGRLHTVWNSDPQNITYVPKYLNTKYEEVAIGSTDGDWELPYQMIHNLEHKNRSRINSTELVQHFRSIMSAQPKNQPGIGTTNQLQWRLLANPQYGAGGTIKEMGGSFDTFLSTLFVNGVTIPRLIEFARLRYAENLNVVRNIFESTFVNTLSQYVGSNPTATIVGTVLAEYPSITYNSMLSTTFGDSTMFSSENNTGMKNWVISLPKLKMVKRVKPELIIDAGLGLVELTHHDGHVSIPTLETTSIYDIVSAIVKLPNCISAPGSNVPTYVTALLGGLFFDTDTKYLYKSKLSFRGSSTPVGVVSSLWHNVNDNLLYAYNGSSWISTTQSVWQVVDINVLYAKALLEVEQRLYSVCDDNALNYDIVDHVAANETATKQHFLKYCKDQDVLNPYGSIYNQLNAFSWNYGHVIASDYDTLSIPSVWSTRGLPHSWHQMYEDLFGTRYPHIQPWKLQHYNEKPYWWDTQYAVSHRRWSVTMWDNIRNGIIPTSFSTYDNQVGTGVANQVTSYSVIPVNQTLYATSDGMYNPDDLLPPYYNSTVTSDAQIIQLGSLVKTLPNQSYASLPYNFGDVGPIEDNWKRSPQYLYSLAELSYVNDPIKFTQKNMGYALYDIDGIVIDSITDAIPSHDNMRFHGELINNKPLQVNGLNQLYVNFLRYGNLDLTLSDFRTMWTGWVPKLGYQVSSFIDVDNVSIRSGSSSVMDNSDFNVVTKKTPGISDSTIESINVVVNSVGTSKLVNGVRIPVAKGADWKFRITTSNPTYKVLKLYGVNTTASGVSFNILNSSVTSEVFYHYPIDKSVIHEFNPGDVLAQLDSQFDGVQGIVNFIDGYVAYLNDQGFYFDSAEHNTIDPDTGRTINWQTETEKLINQIYIGMSTDQLPIHFVGKWSYVSITDSVFTIPQTSTIRFDEGDLIQVYSTNGLPVPIVEHETYAVVNVSGNTFNLADSVTGEVIELTSSGRGTISVGMYLTEAVSPKSFYEVNPFRNTVLIKHPLGVLANVDTGTFTDILDNQGLYDQYGRTIPVQHYRVFRGDRSSYINMIEGIVNDIAPGDDDIHISGAHLFIDGYEHCILFNTSLSNGAVIYDDFLGIFVDKLKLDILTQKTNTLRPSMGGRYLLDGKQLANFESSANELQMMYDTNLANEHSDLVQAGRELLGFEPMDYLTSLGITPKSQFLFYKAMIQQKGSTNAIRAFINLRQFIDAQVDEFWAYKVAEFGDSREISYPELMLTHTDTVTDKLLLQFVDGTDPIIQLRHIGITAEDTRWVNRSNQKTQNLYFNATTTNSVTYAGPQLNSLKYIELPYICDDVVIVADQNPTSIKRYITSANAGSQAIVINLARSYISRCNSVTAAVYRGNNVLHVNVEEISSTSINLYGLTSNGQQVAFALGDSISITIGNATLVEDVHYNRLNNQVLVFDKINYPLHDMTICDTVTINMQNVDKQALSPVKLIDDKARVKVTDIPIWDPVKGYNTHLVEAIIDHTGSDPAIYGYSPIINDSTVNTNMAWLKKYVGQVWIDTTKIKYKPYWDIKINPSVDRRLELWGQLQDWSTVNMSEWIQSPVHPKDYSAYVTAQIKNGNYLAGEPVKIVKKKIRSSITGLFDDPWIEEVSVSIDACIPTRGSIYAVPGVIEFGTNAQVYVNGELHGEVPVLNNYVDISSLNINPISYITIVVNRHEPTVDELKFNPLVKDDTSVNVWYAYDYKYSSVSRYADNGIDVITTYFFWATATSTIHNNLTLDSAQLIYVKPTTPFIVVDNFLPAVDELPNRYTRCALRGLFNMVDTDDRYKLRFLRNFTLRDRITYKEGMVKSSHEQWKLIRSRQQFNIDRVLWNKMIESCSGRSLVDPTKVVPALDRVLYDLQHNTQYKYGIDEGQTFVEKNVAIKIITDQINDPNFDLYPIDRDVFWQTNSFDTNDSTEQLLNTVYDTFPSTHVNRIWFAVLHQALSENIKYTGIMKTSWVQLDSIRILDTVGLT